MDLSILDPENEVLTCPVYSLSLTFKISLTSSLVFHAHAVALLPYGDMLVQILLCWGSGRWLSPSSARATTGGREKQGYFLKI